ncbi:MAG: ABC transporter ATP-binding protein [Candidatus Peribacteria bacterium]|nr:MAG: ABC transporter ATP-binding protein [Candidatus Peribacteria bacterium]
MVTSTSHIGYAPDTTQLFPYLTGYEQMKLVWDLHQSEVKKPRSQEAKKHLSSLLEQVGLDADNTTRVAKYSAGMKKRLGLAMSLVGDPDFLIWDEPMAGVDPLGRITIKNVINHLKSQGKTLLFSTHILSDVEEVANDFAIIHHGRLLYN